MPDIEEGIDGRPAGPCLVIDTSMNKEGVLS